MNPLRAWNVFWFGPISARPLGVFRIVFGLIALANLGLMTVDMDHWFSGRGLLQGTEAMEYAGPLRPSLLQVYQDPTTVRIVFAATALAIVGMTIGWRTWAMSVLAYLGMLTIHNRMMPTISGADVLVITTFFYLVLCPSGAAYSLDARRRARRRGTLAEPLILPWGQRLIQIQLSIVYLVTAILKANGASWLNGTALHYVLNNPEIGRFSLWPLQEYPIAVNLLTHSALLIELALPFFLWFRVTRPWAIAVGAALHFGVLFIVNIPIFGELMVALYLVFLTPDELDAFLGAINPRNWFRRRAKKVEVQVEEAPMPTPTVTIRIDPASPPPGPHRPVRVDLPASVEIVQAQ